MRFVKMVLLVTALVTGWGTQTSFAQYNMASGQNSWKADRQQRLSMIPPAGSRQRPAGMNSGYSQPGVTEQPLETYQAPRQASRIASQASPGRVAQTAARGSNGYLPQKFRGTQADQAIEAPAPRQAAPAVQAPAPAAAAGGLPAPSMALDGYSERIEFDYEQPGQMMVGESYFDDGGSCATCGDCETGCQDCIGYGRVGGVPPGYIADCWMFGLGRILREAGYFGGAQAFQTSSFLIPGTNERIGDCSFGFYTGLNLGLPLRQLTCGLVSGQFGVRTVQSDYNGDLFSSDNRDQLFLTTGFYRRVDYGLQFGVVMDYLRENWFTDTEVIQMRGDLAWVYPTGSAFGFRFTKNVQDWVSDGVVDGTSFSDLRTGTYNQSRFYWRNGCVNGGWADFFLGWTDESHVVGGVEYDIPLTETWAINSGFTYLFPRDNPEATSFAGNSSDAWNVFVGMAWRPMGRNWYRNYDQPLLPVADNGSMVLRRGY
jgi:hypothetical protein